MHTLDRIDTILERIDRAADRIVARVSKVQDRADDQQAALQTVRLEVADAVRELGLLSGGKPNG